MRKFKHDEIQQIRAIAKEVMDSTIGKVIKKERMPYKTIKKEEE